MQKNSRRHILLIILLMILACCNKARVGNNAIVAKEICDTDFDTFFKKFQSDSIFQRSHVKFPLKNTYLNSNGDYEVVREDITILKYKFLDFTGDKEAAAMENGAFTIGIEKQKDSVFYQARGVDNGIHADIKFTLIDGCWYLVAIEDSST